MRLVLLLGFLFSANAMACLNLKNGEQICSAWLSDVGNDGTVSLVVNANDIEGLSDCVVNVPDTGNPHRTYDAKMRACRVKASQISRDTNFTRACIMYCMKN